MRKTQNSSTDKKDVIGTDEGILQSNKELNEIRLKSECYLSLDIGTARRVYARLLIFQDFPPGKLWGNGTMVSVKLEEV